MQRIGAGALRGRVLRPLPAGLAVRPTGSRVREAIFDRLQAEVRDARVLDLFAGTGALAIEAMSRGAARATLVDVHPRVVRFLQDQIRELALDDRVDVTRSDARQFLRRAPVDPAPYDLVLVDPPYDDTAALVPALLAALAQTDGWLAADAVLVCEYDRSLGSPFAPSPFAPSPFAPSPFAPSPLAPSPLAPSPLAPPPFAPGPAWVRDATKTYGQTCVDFLRWAGAQSR